MRFSCSKQKRAARQKSLLVSLSAHFSLTYSYLDRLWGTYYEFQTLLTGHLCEKLILNRSAYDSWVGIVFSDKFLQIALFPHKFVDFPVLKHLFKTTSSGVQIIYYHKKKNPTLIHRKGKWSLKNEIGTYNEQKISKTPDLFSARIENTMDYILWKHKRKGKWWPNGNDL